MGHAPTFYTHIPYFSISLFLYFSILYSLFLFIFPRWPWIGDSSPTTLMACLESRGTGLTHDTATTHHYHHHVIPLVIFSHVWCLVFPVPVLAVRLFFQLATTTAKVRYLSNLALVWTSYYTIVYILSVTTVLRFRHRSAFSSSHHCLASHTTSPNAILAYSSSFLLMIPPFPFPVLPLVVYSCNANRINFDNQTISMIED